jgi:hypothetical protein
MPVHALRCGAPCGCSFGAAGCPLSAPCLAPYNAFPIALRLILPPIPRSAFSRSAAAGAAWTKLAGFEAGRKENVQRAGAWAGQKLRQASAHSAPAAPALEVFADPELQARPYLSFCTTSRRGLGQEGFQNKGRVVSRPSDVMDTDTGAGCGEGTPRVCRLASLTRLHTQTHWLMPRRRQSRQPRRPRTPPSPRCGSGWTVAAAAAAARPRMSG